MYVYYPLWLIPLGLTFGLVALCVFWPRVISGPDTYGAGTLAEVIIRAFILSVGSTSIWLIYFALRFNFG